MNQVRVGIAVPAHISALLLHIVDQLFFISGQLSDQING